MAAAIFSPEIHFLARIRIKEFKHNRWEAGRTRPEVTSNHKY